MTDSFVLAPIGFKPNGVKHELLKQRNRLAKQLEIAVEAMRLVGNDLSPWDKNGHILEEALTRINKLEKENK
jgi:hypothetical protein